MLVLVLILLGYVVGVWSFSAGLPHRFINKRGVGQPHQRASIPWKRKSYWSLKSTATSTIADSNMQSVQESFPWSTSILPGRDLPYMPVFNHQLHFIQQQLEMAAVPLPLQFTQQHSTVKPARIANLCFENKYFRKVRMTYFDAGDSVQVFNTLWYPHYHYDLPLLGTDMISLGKKRVMNVIDCQPLYPTAEYAAKYIDQFSEIKQQYPDMHGTLTGKIYNDTSFFSSQMLFGRFTDESKTSTVVLPAFTDYLAKYVDMVQHAMPNHSAAFREEVKARHAAYDTYSALKDPAVGLFDAYFGKDWSHSFVHDFLFTLSKPPAGVEEASACTASPVGPVHSFTLDADTGMLTPTSASNPPTHLANNE